MVLTRKGTKKAKLAESGDNKAEKLKKSENSDKPFHKPTNFVFCRTKLTNITNLKTKCETKSEIKAETKYETDIKIKQETKPSIDYQKSKPRTTPTSKFGTINPIWQTHFENIRKMRSNFDAPVDSTPTVANVFTTNKTLPETRDSKFYSRSSFQVKQETR